MNTNDNVQNQNSNTNMPTASYQTQSRDEWIYDGVMKRVLSRTQQRQQKHRQSMIQKNKLPPPPPKPSSDVDDTSVKIWKNHIDDDDDDNKYEKLMVDVNTTSTKCQQPNQRQSTKQKKKPPPPPKKSKSSPKAPVIVVQQPGKPQGHCDNSTSSVSSSDDIDANANNVEYTNNNMCMDTDNDDDLLKDVNPTTARTSGTANVIGTKGHYQPKRLSTTTRNNVVTTTTKDIAAVATNNKKKRVLSNDPTIKDNSPKNKKIRHEFSAKATIAGTKMTRSTGGTTNVAMHHDGPNSTNFHNNKNNTVYFTVKEAPPQCVALVEGICPMFTTEQQQDLLFDPNNTDMSHLYYHSQRYLYLPEIVQQDQYHHLPKDGYAIELESVEAAPVASGQWTVQILRNASGSNDTTNIGSCSKNMNQTYFQSHQTDWNGCRIRLLHTNYISTTVNNGIAAVSTDSSNGITVSHDNSITVSRIDPNHPRTTVMDSLSSSTTGGDDNYPFFVGAMGIVVFDGFGSDAESEELHGLLAKGVLKELHQQMSNRYTKDDMVGEQHYATPPPPIIPPFTSTNYMSSRMEQIFGNGGIAIPVNIGCNNNNNNIKNYTHDNNQYHVLMYTNEELNQVIGIDVVFEDISIKKIPNFSQDGPSVSNADNTTLLNQDVPMDIDSVESNTVEDICMAEEVPMDITPDESNIGEDVFMAEREQEYTTTTTKPLFRNTVTMNRITPTPYIYTKEKSNLLCSSSQDVEAESLDRINLFPQTNPRIHYKLKAVQYDTQPSLLSSKKIPTVPMTSEIYQPQLSKSKQNLSMAVTVLDDEQWYDADIGVVDNTVDDIPEEEHFLESFQDILFFELQNSDHVPEISETEIVAWYRALSNSSTSLVASAESVTYFHDVLFGGAEVSPDLDGSPVTFLDIFWYNWLLPIFTMIAFGYCCFNFDVANYFSLDSTTAEMVTACIYSNPEECLSPMVTVGSVCGYVGVVMVE